MKKIVKLYWHLLIFPVLYIPYSYFNTKVLVNWLGCGCPRIDESGNLLDYFSANDFSIVFWSVITLIIITISLFKTRLISKWYHRLIYILLISILSPLIALMIIYSVQWS